jgi:hypothetical protein
MNNLYTNAVEFLVRNIPADDPRVVLESYLKRPDIRVTTTTSSEVFKRLLSSAQNANMKVGVIGGSIGGFDNLGKALYNFDPSKVNKAFAGKPDALLEHIRATLNPRGAIRTTSRSIWPKYCKTVLSTASFLVQFRDGDDFLSWAKHLYDDTRTMPALPLILAEEIEGVGYPLACDFLKDFGFTSYGKPDIHIKGILQDIGLCDANATPYQIQKVISKLASEAGVTPFALDKVLWLIGSGKFYLHTQFRNTGRIGSMRKEFVAEQSAV